MIDENKLIEELKESGFITDNDYGHAMIDFIQNMPKVGEWIPCSGCADCTHEECEHHG